MLVVAEAEHIALELLELAVQVAVVLEAHQALELLAELILAVEVVVAL